MTRAFIIARSPALRAGLRAMLSTQVSIDLLGEAVRLDDLVVPVAGYSEAEVLVFASPDDLPSDAGALLARRGLLMLADDVTSANRVRAIASAGWGLIAPDSGAEELQLAVNAVARGFAVLPATLTAQLLPPVTELETTSGAPAIEIELTPRESEVLECLGRGLPNKLIAAELGITEATVKFHVSAVYVKLGAASRAEAISKAARLGLITL